MGHSREIERLSKDPGYMMLGAKKRTAVGVGGDLENMAAVNMLSVKY